MGLDDEETVFLTQDDQELHMLQQLQTQTGESFDYKQGYDSAIFEVHKQYNLRSKKNTDTPDQNKKAVPNQPKKIKSESSSYKKLSKSFLDQIKILLVPPLKM
jgi:hypothetical protein